jgi:MarR family transcriptional regulator, organic hydroperoxide resistance regulator
MQPSVLDDMVCFSLYAASRAVSQAYRSVLVERDLTYPQFLVLISLQQSGEASVSDLGATMHLDSGTLSPLLQRLYARSFITRERRRGDERVVIVSLTPAGRELRDAVTAAVDCVSGAYGIEQGELRDLLSTLHRITANMNELTASRRATP